MKSIQIGDKNLFLKERMKRVNRDENSYYIEYPIYIKAGAIYKQEYADIQRQSLIIHFFKQDNTQLWPQVKDLDREQTIDFLFDKLVSRVDLIKKEKLYNEAVENLGPEGDIETIDPDLRNAHSDVTNLRSTPGESDIQTFMEYLYSIEEDLIENLKVIEI